MKLIKKKNIYIALIILAGLVILNPRVNAQNRRTQMKPICLVSENTDFKARVEEKKRQEGILRGLADFCENTKRFHGNLSKNGVIIEIGKINDTGINFGGLLSKTSSVKSMSLLDMSLTIDTESIGLWDGGTAFILGQTIYGKGLTESRLGDLQTVSSIEADERTQLSEFWYEQKFLDDKIRIAGGKHDANGEFAILPITEEYLGSSFTLMPNIPMPSYPDQAIGTWGEITPAEWLGFKAGLYDGGGRGDDLGFRTAFEGRDGYITLLQTELNPDIKGHNGSYILGCWTHSEDVETLGADDVQLMNSNHGFYTEFQQLVYKENKKDQQGLTLMGQFSFAPSDRNEIAKYYGAGLTYKGLFPERDEDILGTGLALADLSPRHKDYEGLQNEAVIELFYKFVVNEALTLQPDFQVIINTGGSRKTSFALGLRTIINIAPPEIVENL